MQSVEVISEEGSERLPLMERESQGSWCGRLWNWVSPRRNEISRGVLATCSAVGSGLLVYSAASDFQSNRSNSGEHAIIYGVGLGICGTFLTAAVTPFNIGMAIADWTARWSYELLQTITQLYLNAGCPISQKGFWDDTKPTPVRVQQIATVGFAALSTALTLLSVRPLTVSNNASSEVDEDEYELPRSIHLLESGQGDLKLFVIEQVAKVAIGAVALSLQSYEILTATELLYLSYYLFGNVGGTVFSKIYLFAKGRFLDRCQSARVASIVDKIERIVEVAALGVFFAWTDDVSFVLAGAMAGVTKMVALHRFQLLSSNDEEVAPFQLARIDNIAKGFFLLSIAAWYGSGMTDAGLRATDYANITAYLSTAAVSYPITRYLAANFRPGNNNRLFNSLRFYFVNYQETLILPYMLIRSAQAMGDAARGSQSFEAIKELSAWIFLGLASGNNRALQGIRSHRSPNEVSELALLISWFILTSGGRLR